MSDFLSKKKNAFKTATRVNLTIQQYLDLCKNDPMAYAPIAERMLHAIGEPILVDTSKDQRLGRIHGNKTIRVYPAFSDFYGMETTIEKIVDYFRFNAQGLEERKQILYLLGPVGGGKSSLAERVKSLAEKNPIYVLTFKNDDGVTEISPVFESPFGLFNPDDDAAHLQETYCIPKRYVTGLLSPWAVKRLDECAGDLDRFGVVRMMPSKLRQIAIAKVEPGDENNQDISTIVGKVDIRQLENFSQHDPDAYGFSGGLNRANQGVLEFVEMFKAPIKMLHPLLTATQEGNYVGTENIGAMPFNGIVLAHSNEAEWQTFKNNKNNEAFIDRIFLVYVPYCLQASEETKIYQKLIDNSELRNAPCSPETLEMLARFAILSRIERPDNSSIWSKMEVYDGKTLKDKDPRAKSHHEYKSAASPDEGMDGVVSTRLAFKILSQTFNFDPNEVAGDPVHLMYVLENTIRKERLSADKEKTLLGYIKEYLAPKFAEHIGKEIQTAYLESYNDYGQNMFDRYIAYVDAWVEDVDYKDPDTGQLVSREWLEKEMEKLEAPSGISNAKDFRNEILKFSLRYKAKNDGQNPPWTSYEKIREVIQKKMFGQVEDLLPVISFGSKKDIETEKKHNDFLNRMMTRGYTERQVRRLVDWYLRTRASS